MAIRFEYQPPKVNAALLLAAAKPGIEHAAAEVILAASQPLVPVDKGDLKASGRVEDSGIGAAIVYDAASPEGYPYGIKQHEDLTLHHPNGGQAKFLEAPMHSEAAVVAGVLAEGVRAALTL